MFVFYAGKWRIMLGEKLSVNCDEHVGDWSVTPPHTGVHLPHKHTPNSSCSEVPPVPPVLSLLVISLNWILEVKGQAKVTSGAQRSKQAACYHPHHLHHPFKPVLLSLKWPKPLRGTEKQALSGTTAQIHQSFCSPAGSTNHV